MPVLSNTTADPNPDSNITQSNATQPPAGAPAATLGADDAAVASAAPQPSATPPVDPTPPPLSARRARRWPWVVGGVAVAAAAAGTVTVLSSGDDEAAPEVATRAIRTTVVEQRDLVEFDELDGRMVFADTVQVASTADGVITDVVAAGDVVARGDVAYEINGVPVTVFYGDLPLYRPLAEGSVGDDVEILEANLAVLGYHALEDADGEPVDTGFVVDGVFDAATTDAVLRWQADIGVAETGTVDPTSVLVIDGASTVSSSSVDLGGRVAAGTPMIELDALESVSTAHVEHAGDIDLVTVPGTELVSGDVLYVVDERAIVAMISDETFDRDLAEGVEAGDDVLALETMLVALGYDADGDLEVDDEFTEETTAAITEFEEDLADAYDGTTVDGIVSLDEIVVLDPGTVVGSPTAFDTDVVASGSEMWRTSTSGSRRIVETEIEVADQLGITEGVTLNVEFPDGSIVAGTVVDVASSSTIDPLNPEAEPTLAVEIELSSVPASAAELNELDVEVLVVDQLAAGATVVPASALVSQADGFAVEAVTTTGTTFIPVETGLFADGFVEVSGLQPGTQVVIP